jgi:hypothetical protein
MERQGEEVHLNTREARSAGGPRNMGLVLGISLALVIAVLSALWIGMASHTADVTDPAQRADHPAAASPASPNG